MDKKSRKRNEPNVRIEGKGGGREEAGGGSLLKERLYKK